MDQIFTSGSCVSMACLLYIQQHQNICAADVAATHVWHKWKLGLYSWPFTFMDAITFARFRETSSDDVWRLRMSMLSTLPIMLLPGYVAGNLREVTVILESD